MNFSDVIIYHVGDKWQVTFLSPISLIGSSTYYTKWSGQPAFIKEWLKRNIDGERKILLDNSVASVMFDREEDAILCCIALR